MSWVYFPVRFYVTGGICIVLFVLAFFLPILLIVAKLAVSVWFIFLLIDYLFLFVVGKSPTAQRQMAERFSNSDINRVTLQVENNMRFAVRMQIVDELPFQFQERNWQMKVAFAKLQQRRIVYPLQPFERGAYVFGDILLFVQSTLGLLERKCSVSAEKMVEVYPSFIQLRKFELFSQTSIQAESGSKRMRKIGHSMEFEQIKEYVQGDDIRTINWKATARKSGMMVNSFTDEKCQQVYCIIDKGRLMKMPFKGLSLLDYAINSTLILSSVCLQKQDKVGLFTFSNKMGSLLAADRKPTQRAAIMQMLYNESTNFLETDFEMLYLQLRGRIKQRSLLVLYTNFESLAGLKRQLPYLRSIAKHHLLLVVFFENTELKNVASQSAKNIEEVYQKTIAEKFAYEKRMIVKELLKHGILSVLTAPDQLTINAINKYLELKARQAT